MRERYGKDTLQVMCFDGIVAHSDDRFGDNASTPVGFTQPVTNLGRNSLDI